MQKSKFLDHTNSEPSNNLNDLEIIQNNIRTLLPKKTFPRNLNHILRDVTELFGFEIASVFLLERTKNKLFSISSSDNEEIIIDSRLGICGEAIKKKEIIVVNNAYDDSRFYQKVDQRTGYKTNSIVALPLTDKNQIIGTFQLINKKNGKISKNDIELYKVLTKSISLFLKKYKELMMKEHIQRDISRKANKSDQSFSTKNIVGSSHQIQNIIRIIEQISDTPINVLINGPSGTGKELVAKAIHYSGVRRNKPFVALNCAAIPENLFESELFGIEKGIATGVERKIGKFELAMGGTLFLDEIGDLSLISQAKILRALQEQIIERVGNPKGINLDIRVISATNKDLKQEITSGKFREDLFYRLNVVQIQTPPLKDIPDDTILLANYFLDKYCKEYKREPKKLSKAASKLFQQYSWPGNVRELENLIKRLIILVPNKIISENHIPDYVMSEHYIAQSINNSSNKTLKEMLEELEKNIISEMLKKNNYNQLKTSRDLGISRQGLINKIKQYNLKN